MQIDWFTFFAQIVNFLILVWLMKRFLYGPIIEAMDDREARLKATLQEAEQRRDEAITQRIEYERLTTDLEAQQADLLVQAKKEVEETRRQLLHEVRADVDQASARWRDALEQEREVFLREVRQRTAEEAWRLARHVIGGLATVELEEQVVRVFLSKLEAVDDERREPFRAAVRAGEGLEVRSSFELPDKFRKKLTKALRAMVDEDGAEVSFVADPAVLVGVQVSVAGHVLAWSAVEYLGDLEERLASLVDGAIRVGQAEGEGSGA